MMIDADTTELLKLEYEHGADPALLAVEYGVSEIRIRNLLHRSNAQRARAKPKPAPPKDEPRYARPLRPDCELHTIQDVAMEYRNGFSLRQLSYVYGVDRGTLRRELVAIGVEIRSPTRAKELRRGGSKPKELPNIEDIQRDYEAGESLTTLGKREGVCHHTIRDALKRRGVIIRSRREAINLRDNLKEARNIERAFNQYTAGDKSLRQL